jgi:hypothetical protein
VGQREELPEHLLEVVAQRRVDAVSGHQQEPGVATGGVDGLPDARAAGGIGRRIEESRDVHQRKRSRGRPHRATLGWL